MIRGFQIEFEEEIFFIKYIYVMERKKDGLISSLRRCYNRSGRVLPGIVRLSEG